MGKFIDLTGQKFSRLTVEKYVGKNKRGRSLWLCRCDCNKEVTVNSSDLKTGNTKSCGCFKKEIASQIGKSNKIHGYTHTPTHNTWLAMNRRCNDINDCHYKDYGGRGITVCDRWNPKRGGSFNNFLEDMGERPLGKTLDRIDNDESYCKENCKWSTPKEQSRNMRTNRIETFNGKTQCWIAIAEDYKISPQALNYRINVLGWSPEKALTTSLMRKHKKDANK